MIEWRLEKRKLKDLKAYKKNPRRISEDQLRHLQTSLDKFGLIDKPFINIDNTLIGGHQRLKALKKMGFDEVDVYVPHRELDDKEVEELNIRHNKNSGEWDLEILNTEWESSDLLEWGFNEEDLNFDVQTLESQESTEDEEVPEPPKDPITKPGDLYVLGDHRLLCGDSTLPDDVTKLLGDAEPILMCTDPPYGVNYDPSWRNIRPQKGKNSTGKVQNDDRVNWALAWNLFPGSVAYVWCAPSFLPEVAVSLDQVDFERKSLIIWAKQHFALSRGDYHWQHEACWYVVKKGHQHNWQGSRKESTLWEINSGVLGGTKDEEKFGHGTQKPIECMARPIRNNSCEGEGVYDPFVGSGTTLIAAERLKRKCYAMELAPEYCDIVVNRWINYRKKQGLPHEFARNGEIMTTLEKQQQA